MKFEVFEPAAAEGVVLEELHCGYASGSYDGMTADQILEEIKVLPEPERRILVESVFAPRD